MSGPEFEVVLPPNARIAGLRFEDAARTLHVAFEDGGVDRTLDGDGVRALHGARIRHETITTLPQRSIGGEAMTAVALAAQTRKPPRQRLFEVREGFQHSEDLHFALAIRAAGIGQLMYLLASSFNFRKTLGADATYTTETNVRALVRKLAGFAPQAVQDSFFAAVLKGMALPPPVESLVEFFRTASR
ncbi:MAG TPA: hypothetical protein VN934_10615 [Candidatus Tumulicola sp.]|nr:hypothetical protein [Candidatus Tumulicola sp.]